MKYGFNLSGLFLKGAALLSGFQSLGRLFFFYIGITGGIGGFLTASVSQITIQIIMAFFLLLGLMGLTATLSLLLKKKWGLWCTVLVYVMTVFFDLWGMTVQPSAALGFILPSLSVVFLYLGGSKRFEVNPQ